VTLALKSGVLNCHVLEVSIFIIFKIESKIMNIDMYKCPKIPKADQDTKRPGIDQQKEIEEWNH
jgi:hypothetical protein